MDRKTCVITGASSGIGASLALEYAKAGFNLALVARRNELLKDCKTKCIAINNEIEVLCLEADVNSASTMTSTMASIESALGRIDVVIANAGYVVRGKLTELTLENYHAQFNTNIFGVLHTIYPALKPLEKSKGSLVLIGSVNSYISLPEVSPYAMSKFAIRALADSLYFELRKKSISTTLICPGFVESQIRQVSNEGVFDSSQKDWALNIAMPSVVAARKIKKAIDRKKKEAIITMHAKAFVFLQRHFPWLVTLILKTYAGNIQKRRH